MKIQRILPILILTGLFLFSCVPSETPTEPPPSTAPIQTPTLTLIPTPTPIPLPVPRKNSIFAFIHRPGSDALIKIDSVIQGETILAKAEFLAEEINKQGYLIFRIGKVNYDEEKGTMTFLVKFFCSYTINFNPSDIRENSLEPNYTPDKDPFYFGIPPQNFGLAVTVLESIFYYASQIVSPVKIDVALSFPNGMTIIYRTSFDAAGKRQPNPPTVSIYPQLLPSLKDFKDIPYLNPSPIPLLMYGVSISPEELIIIRSIQGSNLEEKAVFLAEELNKQGEYNFRITAVEYKPAENQLIFNVMFYFSGVFDKDSNSINYNFKPEDREEFNYFTARVLGSIFVYAARLALFGSIVVSVFDANGAISGYFAVGEYAMYGLINSGGTDWQQFVYGYDIALVYPTFE